MKWQRAVSGAGLKVMAVAPLSNMPLKHCRRQSRREVSQCCWGFLPLPVVIGVQVTLSCIVLADSALRH